MRRRVIYFILMNQTFKRAFLLLQFFLVLALLIAASNWENDSSLIFSETLVKDDVQFVKAESESERPRVVFLVIQTRKSPGWCRMLLSSLLSEVSVVSIGFGKRYNHAKRPLWILDYIDNEGLRDEDVVVAFDGGDTFITGSFQVKQAVDRFLEATAPTAAVFNVTAVHRGEAKAPLLFSSESLCFAPLMKILISSGPQKRARKCVWYYSKVWEAMNASADQGMVPFTSAKGLFLNAGGMVGRVWAIREALKAYKKVLGLTDQWWCDQSIWALLYVWSLTRTTNVSLDFRIPYGILNLDYHHNFFQIPYGEVVAHPAVIHLPGGQRSWAALMPELMNHTTWFSKLKSSPQMTRDGLTQLSNLFVKLVTCDGEARFRRFGALCSPRKVIDPDWLLSPLRK
ncbi:hypothetical protein ECC02_011998 [Trypanosoma cruzi]|uniref:Expression site-associated gene (ESAG-like) protein, putative n=2 Tax=Trypanosoma cruzi TaxID=5693 RepID=Q4D924_TRYCC|nr:expression site-associated gene (ESAG-like) protein, putative [Trypanosoma cruzi]EAN89030.1 expression site-associated gene (ESAG-like) protein, putative [Trypanosoma cruzi]KAF5215325.1 hypothetical protein ECC02_011998 [Trypanosoma cruzi]|eukprot:XP_810881.1 expression site-associated gene (ESAG-like) protein [Trypanosoma cruzi strain CL Brener]